MLYLDQLKLTNFKNYAAQSLHFSPQLNCLVGSNGMGKTNVLDSIYYLCMTKSNFSQLDHALPLHGTDFFRLEGLFYRLEKKEKIVAKIVLRQQKVIEHNDSPYQRLSEHIGVLPVVFIGPDDVALIKEGSEERRRFIDNTLSQFDPQYLQALITYNKVLQQRNALLKKWDGDSSLADLALLSIYDQQLQAPSDYIFEQRNLFFTSFVHIFQEVYQQLSGQAEQVDLIYHSHLLFSPLDQLLKKNIGKDIALKRTSGGIHRDDLIFSIDGDHPLKRFGSQGQLKSFLLALKLAQYNVLFQKKGLAPILLLDDLFDKLDEHRITQLIQLLTTGAYGQIFITDTHETRLEQIILQFGVGYRKFIVNKGVINT
jgi:DNA replication and repair protein RecF